MSRVDRPRRSPGAGLRFLAAPVVAASGAAVRGIERSMTFRPTRYNPAEPWAPPLDGEEIWFDTADGIRLHGWLLRNRASSRGAVVYYHGNAGHLPTYLPAVERIRGQGFDVLVWDYRGYGRSAGRPRDEAALYHDGDAAVAVCTRLLGLACDRIIHYGYSLGSVVATEMAMRHGGRALALQAPLASVPRHLGETMPLLPRALHGLIANRFDNEAKIAAIACPVLVIHGERDRTISVAQGRAVFAAAREPKRLCLFAEGEHVLGEQTRWAHIEALGQFIAELAP